VAYSGKSRPDGEWHLDVTIDKREFNGHILVLQEDKTRSMMKPDGTSDRYIIAIEIKKGSLDHRRYITDLMTKLGFTDAKSGAQAVFADPDRYKHILGEDWYGFQR
jgi:hypothetical protein